MLVDGQHRIELIKRIEKYELYDVKNNNIIRALIK